ncbi:hypothetical protein ABH922_000262 [Rhodococcus sp. 27YEA15]
MFSRRHRGEAFLGGCRHLGHRTACTDGHAGAGGRGDRTVMQIIIAANTSMALKAVLAEDNTRAVWLATGQVVDMIDHLLSCRELIERILAEAAVCVDALAASR